MITYPPTTFAPQGKRRQEFAQRRFCGTDGAEKCLTLHMADGGTLIDVSFLPFSNCLLTQNDLETLTTGFQKVVFPNSYNRCRIYRYGLFVNVVSEDMGVKLEESQMVTIELVN